MSSSIPSPILRARNSTMYYYRLPSCFPSISTLLNTRAIEEYLLSPIVKSIVTVCFLYVCRISELLRVTVNDIIQPDRVHCRASKGGVGFMLYLPELSYQVSVAGDLPNNTHIFPCTYSQCYRQCLRAGIRYEGTVKRVVPVLHAYRYVFAGKLHNTIEDTELRDLMHHKEVESQSYYIHKGEFPHGTFKSGNTG